MINELPDTHHGAQVMCRSVPGPNGGNVNHVLREMTLLEMDLVVLTRANAATVFEALDTFIPVYPIFLSQDTVMLTPIQICQINGVDEGSDVIRCTLSRVTTILGAVLGQQRQLLTTDVASETSEDELVSASDDSIISSDTERMTSVAERVPFEWTPGQQQSEVVDCDSEAPEAEGKDEQPQPFKKLWASYPAISHCCHSD